MYSQIRNETKRDRNTYQINSFWSVSGNMFSIKSFWNFIIPWTVFPAFLIPFGSEHKNNQKVFVRSSIVNFKYLQDFV